MADEDVRKLALEMMEVSLELQLKAVRQLLGEDEIPRVRLRRTGSRRRSLVHQSIQILTDEGQPLHVNRIVDLLRERFGRVTNRDSVSSALAKKARQGVLLRQTAPATFGLRQEEEQQ